MYVDNVIHLVVLVWDHRLIVKAVLIIHTYKDLHANLLVIMDFIKLAIIHVAILVKLVLYLIVMIVPL